MATESRTMNVVQILCIFLSSNAFTLCHGDCFFDPESTASDQYCSGHGTCNFETETCECDTDYGLADCSGRYEQYHISPSIRYSIMAASCIVLLCCMALMLWVYYNRELKEVKAMSIAFTQLTLIGCALVCIAGIILSIGLNDLNCVLLEWCSFICICMVIACPLLKAYRIAVIFGSKQLREEPVHDGVLFKKFGFLMSVDVILLTVYTICNFLDGGAYYRYLPDSIWKELRCNSETLTMISYTALVMYMPILIIALVVYARRTRHAAKVFRETQCNYMGANFGSWAFVTFGVFVLFTTDYTRHITVRGYGALVVVVIVLLLLFHQKFKMIYGSKSKNSANGEDYRKALLRQYSANLKDPSGTELFILFNALLSELQYRGNMKMLDLDLKESDINECEQLLSSIKSAQSPEAQQTSV